MRYIPHMLQSDVSDPGRALMLGAGFAKLYGLPNQLLAPVGLSVTPEPSANDTPASEASQESSPGYEADGSGSAGSVSPLEDSPANEQSSSDDSRGKARDCLSTNDSSRASPPSTDPTTVSQSAPSHSYHDKQHDGLGAVKTLPVLPRHVGKDPATSSASLGRTTPPSAPFITPPHATQCDLFLFGKGESASPVPPRPGMTTPDRREVKLALQEHSAEQGARQLNSTARFARRTLDFQSSYLDPNANSDARLEAGGSPLQYTRATTSRPLSPIAPQTKHNDHLLNFENLAKMNRQEMRLQLLAGIPTSLTTTSPSRSYGGGNGPLVSRAVGSPYNVWCTSLQVGPLLEALRRTFKLTLPILQLSRGPDTLKSMLQIVEYAAAVTSSFRLTRYCIRSMLRRQSDLAFSLLRTDFTREALISTMTRHSNGSINAQVKSSRQSLTGLNLMSSASASTDDMAASKIVYDSYAASPFGKTVLPAGSVDLGFSVFDLDWRHTEPEAIFSTTNVSSELSTFLKARGDEFAKGGLLYVTYCQASAPALSRSVSASHTPLPCSMPFEHCSHGIVEPSIHSKDVWRPVKSVMAVCIQRLVTRTVISSSLAHQLLTTSFRPVSVQSTIETLAELKSVWAVEASRLGHQKAVTLLRSHNVELHDDPAQHGVAITLEPLRFSSATDAECRATRTVDLVKSIYDHHLRLTLTAAGWGNNRVEYALADIYGTLLEKVHEGALQESLSLKPWPNNMTLCPSIVNADAIRDADALSVQLSLSSVDHQAHGRSNMRGLGRGMHSVGRPRLACRTVPRTVFSPTACRSSTLSVRDGNPPLRPRQHLCLSGLNPFAPSADVPASWLLKRTPGGGSKQIERNHHHLLPVEFDDWLGSVGYAEDTEQNGAIEIISLASGMSHTLIAYRSTNTGVERIFAVGRNESGQLGIGYNSQETTRNLVEGFQGDRILNVATLGLSGSFVLVENASGRNGLFAMGSSSRGQLGIPRKADSKERDDQLLSRATLVPRPQDMQGSIISIAAGLEHFLALTDQGEVYGSGINTDGQIGSGLSDSDVTVLTRIQLPKGEQPEHIRAGADTSLIITSQGSVWSWGNSEYAQALHGRKIDRIGTPTEVSLNFLSGAGVQDIQLGGSHAVLLDDRGQVYTAGYGAIAHGAELQAHSPTRADGLEGITRIRSGHGYAAAIKDRVNASPDIFAWGLNNPQGRLGLGKPSTCSHVHRATQVALPRISGADHLRLLDLQLGGDTIAFQAPFGWNDGFASRTTATAIKDGSTDLIRHGHAAATSLARGFSLRKRFAGCCLSTNNWKGSRFGS
ncbi:uncharacterized protein L969DRAFT_95074 [Mixia osmundae IAM 14324]|uniref:RCC1-like domain-containing protein n=1 Tax=Mixia osmundae (strain CBS 9802 / IAM 14324 / JCM 22182 / KY 12970) TaxID=764103 RepID=G7E7E1_MIXOS|nr:uncharacterized protein L969DRAFT_95074 [Mixia osmundae IAM 14324]KEI38910.1 hypothetical protein L969DRAFT_95074 [Mixia osmundae IAM 14324]GAA98751.1 hypothetical protein E5Q_05439 [Mixia osmundae IAM 14324]